ncbi:MAG TPA: DUF169 domain-containing protein [Acidimicrobiales bacterium]
MTDHRSLADSLSAALHLAVAPIGISFGTEAPAGVPAFDEPMSEPAADGRAGRVPAGCVFWVRAAERSFTTVPEDHGNCSVGRFTHGLASLEEVGGNDDVAALLESGWVDADAVGGIPSISQRSDVITYGPVAEATTTPDVVLLRVNGRQMMVLSDAMPGLKIEGKPQCHIVALAKEHGEVAASVGCALSRARTGMGPEEMTLALPGSRLAEVTEAVERTAAIDTVVAKYAAEDARRFASAT